MKPSTGRAASLFAQPPVREPLPGDLPSAGRHLFATGQFSARFPAPALTPVVAGISSISSMPRTLLAQARTHYVQESHP